MSQQISIGRVVTYTLSSEDARRINDDHQTANTATPGDKLPAIAVRVWSPTMANLQVLIDGPGTLWATSRNEGTGHGTWHWPERV